ncbi:MAG: hypothetical protein ACKVOB_05445 [Sphingomonas sp.]
MAMSPAMRRYNRDIIVLSLVYAALLIGAVFAFKHHLVTGFMAYPVATLPALPIIGMFAAIGRLLADERDEYLRMLLVRQTLVATAFALSIATVWGFMESFEVVGHVESYYVAILWFGGLGVGSLANRLIDGRRA